MSSSPSSSPVQNAHEELPGTSKETSAKSININSGRRKRKLTIETDMRHQQNQEPQPSPNHSSPTPNTQVNPDELLSICRQMYLAKLQTTPNNVFHLNSLLNTKLNSVDNPLEVTNQQHQQCNDPPFVSPPYTLLHHPPILPLLSQLFASARFSHTIPVPRLTKNQLIESVESFERKHSTSSNLFFQQNDNQQNDIQERATSSSHLENVNKISKTPEEATNTNDYIKEHLLESASRLAFGAILILEISRKAFGLTEASALAVKYFPQLNLTQIPSSKFQVIQQEINNLTAPLFPPLVKPPEEETIKTASLFQQMSHSVKTTEQNEFCQHFIREAINVYEKQIEDFISNSELSELSELTQLQTSQQEVLQILPHKKKAARKRPPKQKLPTIQEQTS